MAARFKEERAAVEQALDQLLPERPEGVTAALVAGSVGCSETLARQHLEGLAAGPSHESEMRRAVRYYRRT